MVAADLVAVLLVVAEGVRLKDDSSRSELVLDKVFPRAMSISVPSNALS